ncbi:hypothetical protein NMY22_g19867 [Coprinellus aureogranulatus]|nr:hypothetical protein NMY22_g19867 [Coprinellus aureogranulatus]
MMKFALAALFAFASSVLTPVVADVTAATNGGGHSPPPNLRGTGAGAESQVRPSRCGVGVCVQRGWGEGV